MQKKLWIERMPMKRLGDVDELNHLAVFLASDGSTYMAGSDIVIDVSCQNADAVDVECLC
jgi:NAD(P)-dependent dehydrogenase (short-subunit alcohol dehydrogenase family)